MCSQGQSEKTETLRGLRGQGRRESRSVRKVQRPGSAGKDGSARTRNVHSNPTRVWDLPGEGEGH